VTGCFFFLFAKIREFVLDGWSNYCTRYNQAATGLGCNLFVLQIESVQNLNYKNIVLRTFMRTKSYYSLPSLLYDVSDSQYN
jgi:hypothetical protein